MKYIDAESLHAFLQKKLESYKSKMVDPLKYPIDHIDLMALLAREYQSLIIQIDSLQQEQLPGIEDPGIPGKDFIPVDWVDACEKYGKWKIVKVK